MIINRTGTLFSRTGMTIAVSLLIFFVLAFSSIFYYIVTPTARQSADDLAALIMFSAQTWAELPPDTRYDFTKELYASHRLTLTTTEAPLIDHPTETPYMRYLEDALSERVGVEVPIKRLPSDERWLWVIIPTATRSLNFGFPHSRIGVQPSIVILWIILGGVIVTILSSLLVVSRLTLPLQRLYNATKAFSSDQKPTPIPETGPHELATLTKSFNQMTSQIHELLENRTTLMAGISHDLRTPITRVQLALEMLGEEADPSIVNMIRNDLDEMTQLIQRTMEMAKGLDRDKEDEIETNLVELIDQVVAHYQNKESHTIDWQLTEACIQRLNPVALRRVLTNLLENALSYASNDSVGVECECGNESIIIQILDRGPGIPPQELQNVFQPFHRLEASRNKATGGSGLGLAIVKQLCDANGWKVHLQPRQGGGTIARLMIPLPQAKD